VSAKAVRKAVGARCRRVREVLTETPAEALLVTKPVEVSYLSGFTGEDSWLVVGKGKGALISDGRFLEEVERECPDVTPIIRRGSLVEALAKVVRRKRLATLGYDPAHVSVALLSQLRKGLKGVGLVRAANVVGKLRETKDRYEVGAIRRAIRVAEEAWTAMRRRLRMGMTEHEIATELEHQMRQAGADGRAFPTIVAVNAHAARPHAKPGRRQLKPGAVLLIDFGALVDGYVSDLTRVLFADRIAPRARAVYDIVREAQAAAIDAVRPGAGVREVDAAARSVIRKAGYAKQFGHGLGHGVGREVHEQPRLGPRGVKGNLEPGMVVTIEPGIYLRGRFGIRLEDDVLVTATGRSCLSRLTKEPDDLII